MKKKRKNLKKLNAIKFFPFGGKKKKARRNSGRGIALGVYSFVLAYVLSSVPGMTSCTLGGHFRDTPGRSVTLNVRSEVT